MKKGFSMLELLIVIAMAAVVFAFSAPFALNLYRGQLVAETQSNIVSALLNARHNATLQKNDSAWGVSVSLTPNSYVLFQGASTSTRDEAKDEVYPVVSEISFSGLTDVVFSKLTGVPSATGTLNITYGSISKGILVDDSGTVSQTSATSSSGEVIVTPTYSITFDKNDAAATGTMALQGIASGESANLTANAFTKAEYSFAGWATSSAGAVAYADEDSYTMGSADVTLYAKWEAVAAYRVYYFGNGNDSGTAPTDSTSYHLGDTVTVLGNTGNLAQAGYIFTGWNTLANGDGGDYAPASTFEMGSADANLYAQWSDGLIAHWTFDGNTDDSSGNGYNGTLVTGVTAAAGVTGEPATAYAFNGTWSQKINTPAPQQFGNETYSAWVKLATTSDSQVIVGVQEMGLHYDMLGAVNGSGTAVYEFNTPSGNQAIFGTSSIMDNNWHMITATRDDTNMSIYVDGQLQNSAGYSGTPFEVVAGGITIGYSVRGNPYYPVSGSVDNVRVYNRALSGDEITAIYDAEKPATHTVTFDANGGTGSMSMQSITDNTSANLATSTLTRDGYTFTGWATSTDGAVAYADTASYAMGTADVTLYAQWSDNLLTGLVSYWSFDNDATSGPSVIVDDGDAGFSKSGTWLDYPEGYGNNHAFYKDCNGAGAWAKWEFTVPETGDYEILGYHGSPDYSTEVITYDVLSDSGSSTVVANMSIFSSWNPITSKHFTTGTTYSVTLKDNSCTLGVGGHWADADAVMITKSFIKDSAGENGGYCSDVTCPAVTDGVSSGAYSFIGTSGYVNYLNFGTADNLNSTSTISVSAWVRPSTSNQNGSIVSKWYSGGGTDNSYALGVGQDAGNNKWDFVIEQSNGTAKAINPSAPTFSADNWYHVVGVADGSVLRMYINGVDTGQTIAYDGTIKTTQRDMIIGRLRTEDTTYTFAGKIDNVRVYNRALTADEVSVIYNAEKP